MAWRARQTRPWRATLPTTVLSNLYRATCNQVGNSEMLSDFASLRDIKLLSRWVCTDLRMGVEKKVTFKLQIDMMCYLHVGVLP